MKKTSKNSGSSTTLVDEPDLFDVFSSRDEIAFAFCLWTACRHCSRNQMLEAKG